MGFNTASECICTEHMASKFYNRTNTKRMSTDSVNDTPRIPVHAT